MRYGYPGHDDVTNGRMLIAKSSLIDLGDNFAYGVFAVAVSILVFAYSTRFGPVPILVFYALWLPLVLVDYRQVLGNYLRFWWIFPFVIFACLSYSWSVAPGVSMRASIQYLTTIVCALIASRTIDLRTLLSGMNVGVFIALIYSLYIGDYHYDPLDGTYSLVGAFASKNQVGFYASLGVYSSFATLTMMSRSPLWRWFAWPSGALAVYCLYISDSATSIITTAVVMTFGITALFIGRMSPRIRIAIFCVVLLIMPVVAVVLQVAGFAFILEAFGKDATLTGRTYLWQVGLNAVEQYPLAGRGYQAYWVQGFAEAERLWEEFYIATRTGFHFHNTYIEALVETGYIGFGLLVLMMLMIFAACIRDFLIRDNPEMKVLFAFAIMLLIRSFFEIDILQPYVIGSFLLYYTAGMIAIPQRQVSADDPER